MQRARSRRKVRCRSPAPRGRSTRRRLRFSSQVLILRYDARVCAADIALTKTRPLCDGIGISCAPLAIHGAAKRARRGSPHPSSWEEG